MSRTSEESQNGTCTAVFSGEGDRIMDEIKSISKDSVNESKKELHLKVQEKIDKHKK